MGRSDKQQNYAIARCVNRNTGYIKKHLNRTPEKLSSRLREAVKDCASGMERRKDTEKKKQQSELNLRKVPYQKNNI